MATTPDRTELVSNARSVLRGGSPCRPSGRSAGAGLVARVVYGVIGVLALKLALGSGGKTTSQSGALQTIAREPFGEVLLIVLAIGLGAYALWSVIDAVAGSRPDDDGALKRRVSAIASAIAYGALCLRARVKIVGARVHQQPPGTPRRASWVGPAARVIVAIAGAGGPRRGRLPGIQGAMARTFLEELGNGPRMSQGARRAFTGLGLVGHVARAVIFILIAYGLIKAALDLLRPRALLGLDGALQNLAHASAGPLLLGLIAVGFIALALYLDRRRALPPGSTGVDNDQCSSSGRPSSSGRMRQLEPLWALTLIRNG